MLKCIHDVEEKYWKTGGKDMINSWAKFLNKDTINLFIKIILHKIWGGRGDN